MRAEERIIRRNMVPCGKCQRDPPEGALFCPFCGAGIVPAQGPGKAIDPLVGQTIRGTYFVQERIGGGGMGQVYKATQLNLDRPVALKLLRPWFHAGPTIVQRFQREARASSKLHHPNVIAVLDFGQAEDGTLFMAMEYLPGRNLLTLLEDEFPLGERRVVHIAAQILSALAEAHAAGIVHRDLKPANVMVETRRDEPDFVKVVDFGIAQIQEPGDCDGQLTQTGLICGTPDYVSPEQASLLPIDARSDLYSVGVLLYQMLTGRHPFDATTPPAMVQAHVLQQPPPMAERCPSGRRVSPALEAIVFRALAKNAVDRFQTAEEMRRELLECPLDPDLAEGAADVGSAVSSPAAPASARSRPAPSSGPPSRATPPVPVPVADADSAAAAQEPASGTSGLAGQAAGAPEAPAGSSSEPARPPARRRRAGIAVAASLATVAAVAALLVLGRPRHGGADAGRRPEVANGPATGSTSGASAPAQQPKPTVALAGGIGAPPAQEPARAAAPGPELVAATAAEPDERARKPATSSAPGPRPKGPRAASRASGAAPAALRAPDRRRGAVAAAPPSSGSARTPQDREPRPNPPRTASTEPAQVAAATPAAGVRREAFATREILAYQQSFGDPALKARGRGLVARARWLVEPNGIFVFAPADEAPGFFPLAVRATREGGRVRFDGLRTAAATGGPGYVRISGDLSLTHEPILTVDLEFGRALGKDGAKLETTYRARARLRLAPE